MRHASIDILRSLAIVVMVVVHFGENLSGWTPPVAGFGAPVFAYLSGVSWVLWWRGRVARGATDEEITRTTLRRGLFVFGVGIAFNVLVWMPEDVFNWDVLTFVGSGLLFLELARRMPRSICILVAVLVLLVAPVARAMVSYEDYWQDMVYDPGFALADVLIGYLATGYFPILPWLAFTLLGYLSADLVANDGGDEDPAERRARTRGWLGVGVGLVTLAFVLDLIGDRTGGLTDRLLGGRTMFPPSMPWTLRSLGTCVLLLIAVRSFADRPEFRTRHPRIAGLTELFSRYSLTIYVVHHVVHLWPLWILDVLQGRDVTESWQQATTTGWAMALSAVYLVVTWLVLRRIGPSRRFGLESAMRWLCDEPIRGGGGAGRLDRSS